MLQLPRASRLLAGRVSLGRPAAAGGARAFAAGREGSAQTTAGPGLTNPGVQSEQEVNQTKDRLYQGDSVEDAPRARTFKPDQEQPAAQDIDQGTGAERVQTPASPGRPADTSEPKGGPM